MQLVNKKQQPMQKMSTPLNKTDLIHTAQPDTGSKQSMQPSETTISKIMQFASNYRVQKISENQYVEMNLS
jgi:hypothetical protein